MIQLFNSVNNLERAMKVDWFSYFLWCGDGAEYCGECSLSREIQSRRERSSTLQSLGWIPSKSRTQYHAYFTILTDSDWLIVQNITELFRPFSTITDSGLTYWWLTTDMFPAHWTRTSAVQPAGEERKVEFPPCHFLFKTVVRYREI